MKSGWKINLCNFLEINPVWRGNSYFSPSTVGRKVILVGDLIRVIHHAFPTQRTAHTQTLIQKAKFKVMDFSQHKAKHVIKHWLEVKVAKQPSPDFRTPVLLQQQSLFLGKELNTAVSIGITFMRQKGIIFYSYESVKFFQTFIIK